MAISASGTRVRGVRAIPRHAAAWLVGVGRSVWLFPLEVAFRTVGLRYGWLRTLFQWTPAPILASIGQLRAERAAWRAARNVPAYRRYLTEQEVHGDDLFPLGILSRLPETDKLLYVDRYPLLERCVHGAVPFPGTTTTDRRSRSSRLRCSPW